VPDKGGGLDLSLSRYLPWIIAACFCHHTTYDGILLF